MARPPLPDRPRGPRGLQEPAGSVRLRTGGPGSGDARSAAGATGAVSGEAISSARLESEGIHASVRQSRKSWRTPYFRQSRAQRAPREGALAKCVAGKRSLTVAAPIGVPRSSTSVSRTRQQAWKRTPKYPNAGPQFAARYNQRDRWLAPTAPFGLDKRMTWRSTSKGEAGLELDSPVVRDASAAAATAAWAAAAEAGVDAGGLAELRGVEIADKSAWVVVVKQVVKHHRERDVVAILGGIGGAADTDRKSTRLNSSH